MEEATKRLLNSMGKLQKGFIILKYWTYIVIIALAILIGINVFIPTIFLPVLEPFLTIVAAVYLIFLIVLVVTDMLVKDNQKKIMIGVIRALLGFILPVPLVLLTFHFGLKLLGIILVVVGIIIFLLIFKPINDMIKAQRAIVVATKKAKREK